ncbi:hypothetical protein CgunFtcFv8_011189 [Champsocephalus gunnari]|uniref:Endonuclease/exonuclease/phosphatase domain-containing protein n=1 Tax=Champsocephalus gunnari TaxID=52237 RepID=A0AAN8DWQ2_CHAGU|nr:hypothetical protein CgunFtcFv8_011189 [Champsocephalus gunnari]
MAADFPSYLDSLNLTQHVHGSTHNHGHTLDLIITGNIPASDLNISDLRVSDHKAISLTLTIPSSNERVMKYRNIHHLDTPLFLKSITPNLSNDLRSFSPDDMIELYNDTMTTTLNMLAPEKRRKATFQKSSPWFTVDSWRDYGGSRLSPSTY